MFMTQVENCLYMKRFVGFCVQILLKVVSMIFYWVIYECYVSDGGYFW